jgi:serine/threonine protein kinase
MENPAGGPARYLGLVCDQAAAWYLRENDGDDFGSSDGGMSDLTGRQLGQYEVRELVRHGGMASVYKAYQPSLDRWVAIKVLARPDDSTFVARFEAEARSIARFQHPNIVPVHDYGEQEGHLYLVVTYVEEGRSLADLVGEPMAADRALQFGVQVLAGLSYAHGKGVVHRDIKPANVLLPSPDWPMLADFGIAKLLLGERRDLTQPGMVLGTAAYMAPEQTFGLPVDERTDLYSVGVVLYELITGRVPFDADTPVMVMMKQAYEPPEPLRTVVPDVPVQIEQLLLQALAKDPNDRFQSAEAMSAAITATLAQLKENLAPSVSEGPLADGFMAGVDAYTAGRWAEAVARLTSVHDSDPNYENVEALLKAARTHEREVIPAPASPEQAAEAAPQATPAPTPPAQRPARPAQPPPAPAGQAGQAPPATPPPATPAGQAAPATPPPATPRPDRGRAPAPADRGPKAPRAPAPAAPGGRTAAPAASVRTEPDQADTGGEPEGRRRTWRPWAVAAVAAAAVAIGIWLSLGDGERGAQTAPPVTTTAAPKPPERQWTATARSPLGVESAGTAVFKGKVWIVGGFDGARQGRADAVVYDPAKDTWSEGPKLPRAITHAALVSTGKELFVIGGYAGSTTEPIATVRRLDEASNSWVRAPSLPGAVGAGAAAWDGRRIVYAGGVGADGEPSSSVLAFENGAWRRLGRLSRAREHLAAASDGKGTTYFLAGEVNRGNLKTALRTVDAVKGNTVRKVGDVPTARGSVAGFFSRSDGACVGGGRDGAQGLHPEVECIGSDGVTKKLPSLRTPRHGLGMVVTGGRAYALLGSDNEAQTFRTGEVLPLAS